MVQHFDLAIASDWNYDSDYIRLLEQTARESQLRTYIVWPDILENTVQNIENGNISFGFFYDRASDTSLEFLKLQNLMVDRNVPVLDKWQNLKWAADKAIMHGEFIAAGINTPYTRLISSFKAEEQLNLTEEMLRPLGNPFIAKPANTVGGGRGVIKEARIPKDILEARQTFPSEKYLLQEKIIPLEKDNRRFWFRGYYTCGLIQAAWWNDLTHLYDLLTEGEIERYYLHPLFEVIEKIASVCRINFFSTEIALDSNGKFIAIDYVNEVCDMRPKSNHFDGVPDEVVKKIAHRIVAYVKEALPRSTSSYSHEQIG
jgi:hypothetical protein